MDEYDKPILDVLHDPDLAKANRDYLRGFYGIIKGSAEHVRFVFVSGVSMFSKVSLFSGLNNLDDISLDPRFATICGYTEDDLGRVFGPELDGLDRETTSGPGTTAITGGAESGSTIPMTCCCCCENASSVHTGSRPGLQRSCSGC